MQADEARELILTVNGESHRVRVAEAVPLLYTLRNDLGLNGPKFGCGLGECGACCVLIDGAVARACVTATGAAVGHDVLTLEGLGSVAAPSAVQAAFIEEQATQCGYCLNGMVITAHTLLSSSGAQVSESQVVSALRYNLCRCGAHVEIVRAVMNAAAKIRAGWGGGP